MTLYKQRLAKGLCGSCGKAPPEPGRSQCAACGEASRQRSASKRQALRDDDLCLSGCGNPAEPGKTRCLQCAAKQTVDQRQRVAGRKEAGLCAGCGQRPPKDGCTLCQLCIDARSAVSSSHYARRKAAGTCYFCDNPPEPGFKLCAYHREKYADYRLQTKLAAFEAYGGPVCVGCGNDELEILEIDHVDGGGCKHRKAVTNGVGGYSFYLWLQRNGYPNGYRVLCPTCNKKAHAGLPLPCVAAAP